jgi:hypothetical protein
MSPDAGYFLGERYFAKLAHRPLGTVLICIPTGFVLLALFNLLRRDLCYLLPSPHRTQLTPLANQKGRWNLKAILVAAISICLGAWTHIIWDQFTHDGSFLSRHFAPLRTVLFYVGPQEITISYVLQYISTIVGAAILAWYYWNWSRSQPQKTSRESDTWRYFLIFGLAAFSLVIGTAVAIYLSAPVREFQTLREFVYKMGISAVSVFALTFIVSAILCYSRRAMQRDACDPSHGTGQK